LGYRPFCFFAAKEVIGFGLTCWLAFFGSAVPAAAAVLIKEEGLLVLAFAVVYIGMLGTLTALFFWLAAKPDQRRTAQNADKISN
jgi:hypothetical protein